MLNADKEQDGNATRRESLLLALAEMQDSQIEIHRLFEAHREAVYAYLCSMSKDEEVASDLTQDTFLRIFEIFDRFDPQKGDFQAWAFGIARFAYLQYLRKIKRVREEDLKEWGLEDTVNSGASFPDNIYKKQVEREIKIAISLLPEPEKSIVIEKRFSGRTLSEVAQKVELSERTVSRKYANALRLLKAHLEKVGIRIQNGGVDA